MSYFDLLHLLQKMFQEININNGVNNPDKLMATYDQEINPLWQDSGLQKDFVELGADTYIPKPVEVARVLRLLKRRMRAGDGGKPLVGRIRAEVLEKRRPLYDQDRVNLSGIAKEIARTAKADMSSFSKFQVEGWMEVNQAIEDLEGMVIVAPTGSGKTEVFLMPVIWRVA